MTYSGFDIFQKTRGPGTSSLVRAQSSSGSLKQIHENLVQNIGDSQKSLADFWKGQSAATGSAGLTPLIQASQLVAENLDRAQRSMQEQADNFQHVQDNAKDVAKDRANDNTPEDWFSIGASDDEKAAAKFDADTKFNVELYEPYYQTTQPRKSTLAADYPAAHDPNVSAGGVTPNPVDVSASGGHQSSAGHSAGSSGGYTGGPSTYTPPPGAAGYQAPPPPGHSPSGVTPPSVVPTTNDHTSAAFAGPTQTPGGPGSPSWQGPGGAGINGPGGSNSGFGPGFGPVGGFGGGSFGSGGGRGGFGPGGSGSGFGPGGGGASSGGAAGVGRGVGAGAGTGAGAMGEGAGAARPGGMGAAGAKGQAGMGGMGGGGNKGGKGPEDEEHQRKILLTEEDPDSIFGGYDGNRPTPPVIGA
ncbi:hypothetical protein VSH64_36170 [Amycolatopsis rhabdoformis]|uniref:WXG100 family type VII secretion target n=1 Tax=Amycolatopsis rhabdoformis TaxID=1448059 RepID=A0ABZ1I1H4_9PSEU|nr:hypothetical protein [Amycolatopsis rhabdoformis]WSE28237.1 hypothetical protein VSH64_36170 [Amycolatopsis rhabdoformis]